MPTDILQTLIKHGMIDFSKRTHYYIPWKIYVDRQLGEKGLQGIMSSSYQPPRVLPAIQQIQDYEQKYFHFEINGRIGNPPLQPGNDVYLAANRYESDMQKYQALAGQALALIQTNLSATQVAACTHILSPSVIDNRTKALQIMMYFKNLLGKSTMAQTNPIKDEMDHLPIATDATSAEYLVANLTFWNHCLELLEPPAAESDSAMIARLFHKLKGTMFDLVAQQINETNPTFLIAVEMLTRTITLHRQRNPSLDHITSTQSDISTNMYQVNQQTDIANISTPCWNCRQNPQITFHTRDACRALHCTNCSSAWTSYTHPEYHKFTECPYKINQVTSLGRKNSSVRHSNNISYRPRNQHHSHSPSSHNYRNRDRSRTPPPIYHKNEKNKKPRTVAFQVQSMDASVSDITSEDEELIRSHLQDDYPSDIENSDNEDKDFHCHMMSNTKQNIAISNDIDIRVKEVAMVLQDSGANICATSPAILHLIPNLVVYKWPSPRVVTFGNGNSVTSEYFVNLGPILHHTAILGCLTNTILAVPKVNRRGYNINFTHNMKCVITYGDDPTPIIEQPVQIQRDLYYVDIMKLYTCKLPNIKKPCEKDVNDIPVVDYVLSAMRKRKKISKQEIVQALKLHNNMSHAASPAAMAVALRYGAWPGIQLDPTVVEHIFQYNDCLACVLGKSNKLPRSLGSGLVPLPFTECSVDYKPVNPTAIGGYVGFYMFVEKTYTYKFAVFLKQSPTTQSFIDAVKKMYALFKSYGKTIKILRCDAGIVESSQEAIYQINIQLEIQLHPASPECQYQNPVERTIQTVLKGIGTMFISAKYLSNAFWALAMIKFLDASNCTPNMRSGKFSPEYYLTGKHPNILSRFKFEFGQPITSVLLDADKKKLKQSSTFTPSSEFGYAVGSIAHNYATLVYLPARNKQRIYVRKDVRPIKMIASTNIDNSKISVAPVFNEDNTVTFPSFPPQQPLDIHIPLVFINDYNDSNNSATSFTFNDLSSSNQNLWLTSSNDLLNNKELKDEKNILDTKIINDDHQKISIESQISEGNDKCVNENINNLSPLSCSHRMLSKDNYYNINTFDDNCFLDKYSFINDLYPDIVIENDYNISMVNSLQIMETTSQNKKKSKREKDSNNPTLGEAQQSPEYETFYVPAMNDEFNNIANNNVYEEVDYDMIPSDAIIYPTKMVLTKKYDTSGVFIKCKARLVVVASAIKNFFKALFSPTVNDRSVRLLCFLAVLFNLLLVGIDIKGAFLYPDLPPDKKIYVTLPKKLTGGSFIYWKLKKTLYGLEDSPRAFYEDCSKLLLSHGYSRTIADPCMFYKRVGLKFIFLIVHVDDFLCAASDENLIEELLTVLRSRYEITVSTNVENYIGLHIEYTKNDYVLLSQPHQIEMLAKDYNLLNVNCPTVPMSSLFNDEYQNNSPLVCVEICMQLLGRLMFIVKTRPDIAFAVNRLATRAHIATEKDFKSLLRIVSYLYGTKHLGLKFKKSSNLNTAAATKLSCYVDASYATHPDSKSHTGYCFCLGESLAMFYSRTFKQTNVTLSSTEAENAAAVEATKEIIWFRQLLSELGFPQLEPTIVFADNASMITLAKDFSGNHKRVKHYMTRINFMIEQIQNSIIDIQYVDSKNNIADILTKPLGPSDFLQIRPRLLGYE